MFTIEPTNHCNFRCRFCPQSNPEHHSRREKGYMAVEKMDDILKKISELKTGNRNIAFVLDGEPLLHNQFVEFVRIANQYQLRPRFSSNGKLLIPSVIDQLINAGFFTVAVDFSATPEIFEQCRGSRSDWQHILENLRYLIKKTQENHKFTLEIFDISHFITHEASSHSLNKLRKNFPGKTNARIRFYSRIFHNFTGHLGQPLRREHYRLCPYPWFMMSIAWNGDVVACCRDTAAKTIMGNIFNESIENIWRGSRYQQLRSALINKTPELSGACRNCDLPWDKKRWNISYLFWSFIRR